MKTKTKKAKLTDLKGDGAAEPAADAVTFVVPRAKEKMETGGTPVLRADEFKMLPIGKVRPDPNQPRKDFNEGKLKELAESIKAMGIVQPIIVQLVPAELKILEPDMANDQKWQAVSHDGGAVVYESVNEIAVTTFAKFRTEDFYQIVDGERRWRAAGLLELAEVPCVVRSLEAHKVFTSQWTANQARENLSALEEGHSFARTIAERQKSEPKFSKDDLAAELGIARGTVYNRITLTRLTPAVTEALTGGKIEATVAGRIAMIPDPKRQEHLLKKITNENDWHYPFSFREVEDLIEDEYCKQLKDAPFDLKERMFHGAQLIRGSWHWNEIKLGDHVEFASCDECPHRTGNMKDAFPHIKNVNVCTKPGCYQNKCVVHFAAQAKAAEKKGQKVMTQKDFKAVKSQYVEADAYDYTLGGYSPWEHVMGKKAPAPTLVITEAGLKKVYVKEEAIEAGIANGKIEKPGKPEDKAKEEAKRQEAIARKESREQLVETCAPMLLKALATIKDALAWELAAEMVNSIEWTNPELEAALVNKAKGSKAAVLGRCFADHESYPVLHSGDWNKENVALWKRAGVDLLEEEKKVTDKLPLKKAEAQQKELLVVKKNRKK